MSSNNIDRSAERAVRSTCVHCLEPIAPGARRCPECQSWQRRWAGDSQNPLLELVVVGVGLILVVALAVLWFSGANGEEPVRSTAVVSTDLVVSDARVVTSAEDGRPFVAVLGRVVNRGTATWRNIYFHIELLDADGGPIDVFSGRDYALVVPPGEERPFKVADYSPIHEISDYAEARVEVTWAQRVE